MLKVAEMMFPVRARSGLIARISDMDSREAEWSPMTATLRRRMKLVPSCAPVSILLWKDWPSTLVVPGSGEAAMAWSASWREK